MNLTDEQTQAVDLAREGHNLSIQAGAGTGKTSTLVAIAESSNQRITYTAFNKSIVTDSADRFPERVESKTTHALAYRAVGHRFRARITGARMRSDRIARILGIDPIIVRVNDAPKVIQPSYLGSLAMRAMANYCQSDDVVPGVRHVPYVEGIDPRDNGGRTYANNDMVANRIAEILPDAWLDLINPTGRLPYRHDAYVKLWEQGRPRIPGDQIMLDEAQDTAPVMASILRKQGATQIILVGDENQAIYGWRGAVDAFSYLRTDATSYLTQSFRFGPAIANVANLVLAELESPMELSGLSSIASTLGTVDPLAAELDAHGRPDTAVLTRTNAKAMEAVFRAQRNGKRVYLMGGPGPILAFAKAAQALMAGEPPHHADLACFDTWAEVVDYVENDPQGDDLALMVRMVMDHGVDAIIAALGDMPKTESGADLVVSTAHKAKGREWDRVLLTSDFVRPADAPVSPADLRLLYVAVTRAKYVLDPYAAEVVADLIKEDDERNQHDAEVGA